MIYIYQWEYNINSPKIETKEDFLKRKGFTTDKEIIDSFKSFKTLKWFMGTQEEWKAIDKTQQVFYYHTKEKPIVWSVKYVLTDFFKDGRPQAVTFDMVMNRYHIIDATQNTKAEFDAQLIITARRLVVRKLQAQSSPKLAAYISKGSEYILMHLDTVKSGALQTLIGTNGKVDLVALTALLNAHQHKIDSMTVLVQLFAKWLLAIETGTEDSLKELPYNTPTELNAEILKLWKIEEDQERQTLASKLGFGTNVFTVADKYLQVGVGDEPEKDND